MVGWCEGVTCVSMSPGHPIDIGLQLFLYQVRVEGECFYFFCFFTFIPVPLSSVFLSHLFYYLFYRFSPFLWEMTQNDPQGLMCH